MSEVIDEVRTFRPGDIVRHFKWEKFQYISEISNVYRYEIVGVSEDTETGEKYMVYKSLYDGEPFGMPNVKIGKLFHRKYDMFVSEVDHEKYPDIQQKYRFEVIR